MNEAILIFPNMRGGCVTVGNTVHALFRMNGRRPGLQAVSKAGATQGSQARSRLAAEAPRSRPLPPRKAAR